MSCNCATSNAELTSLLTTLQSSLQTLQAQLSQRDAEIAELRRMLFGQSRERHPKMPSPSTELRRNKPLTPAELSQKKVKTQALRKKRSAVRKTLPEIVVPHDISSCPHCECTDLEDLKSPELSVEIEFVPSHFVRKVHTRAKKKCCRCCRVVTAPAPHRVTDGAIYGPGLHARVVVAKCADSIPVHRLAKQFSRDGVPIERSSLNRLFHRTAELLEPLSERILELVVAAGRVNADETPILIQAPGKCRRGYVWTFLHDTLIAYVFSASRSGDTPKRVLADTQGFLQVDAYTGYNVVCLPTGRTRMGCLAHMRRKFFDAAKTAPKESRQALDRILQLYQVEYDAAAKGLIGTATHLAMRRKRTKKIMDEMLAWMLEEQPHHLPKSPMGKALGYATKQWGTLQPLLDDAEVRLDNNLAENALRIIALGRKNFLFVGDGDGGKNLAILQTIVATCTANGVNPETYIADVVLRLDETPTSRIDDLLPMNWKPTAI